MRNIVIIVTLVLLTVGCAPEPKKRTDLGIMSRTVIRTETLAPVGSEDFQNYSALFVDETVIEGNHDTRNRYIVSGMDTLAWPQQLSIHEAVVLLSGLEDSVVVIKETYVRNGMLDFVLFWKNTYEQKKYSYMLSWTENGNPYFEKTTESNLFIYKNENLVWTIITIILFLYCFIAIGFSSGELIKRHKSVGLAGFMAIIIAIVSFAITVVLGIIFGIVASRNVLPDYDHKLLTVIIPLFLSAPLGILIGFFLVFIRGVTKGTIDQLRKWF